MLSFANIQEEIASMLAIPDEELNEEQKKLMDEYLNELAGQESSKIDAFAQFLKIQTQLAGACKDEAKRLMAKADTVERRLHDIKRYYLETMQKHGIRKIVGNAYTLSVRNSEAVMVTDMEALKTVPDMVKVKTVETPDKLKIKAAIKAGENVPGAFLEICQSLQVR